MFWGYEMNIPATESSIEVASWFMTKARKDDWFLENEKLQQLLFLAQVHYAILNNGETLMPTTFVVARSGFEEPNLSKALSAGFQLQSMTYFSAKVANFLEKIWSIYGSMSIKQLSDIIKSKTNYLNDFQNAQKSIVELKTVVENFKSNVTISANNIVDASPKKVLISQNGPVVVSQWMPRRVADKVFEI